MRHLPSWLLLSVTLVLGCRPTVPEVAVPFAPAPPGPTPHPGETPPPPDTTPSVNADDLAVAYMIRQTFRQEPALAMASRRVTVAVHKGVVTLRGTVTSVAQRDELVERIRTIPGVDRVEEQLQVGAP